MIYLILYLVNTLAVVAFSGEALTPALLTVTGLLTVPGWVAVWYSNRKHKGSLR